MTASSTALIEQVVTPRSLLLRSEEINSSSRAMQAMAIALGVPGVLSVSTHVAAQSIFVMYSRLEAKRELKQAMEEAGFPLLI